MSDALSDVCSKIRQAIAHPSTLSVDQVAELLGQYNAAVDEVNVRFRRAQSWLRRGLRAEALGLIEEWPDALESARLLELGGGWGQWADLVVQADVGEARAIDTELATELNEAYDLHQETLPLLVEYRRAALLALPPQQQINILRKLRAVDPTNTVWKEQQRSVEELYFSMLNRQAKTALNNRDYEGLLRILEVSRSSGWVTPPPPAFVAKLEQSVGQLRATTAAEQFSDIASRLHEAFGAFDEQRIERLVAEWNEALTLFNESPNHAVNEAVAPIFMWWEERLAEQSREAERERLQALLAQQLDESAPLNKLEQTHAALDRLEVDIQPALLRRYRLRCETLHAARRRRSRMVLAGATVAAATVAVTVGFTLREQSRSAATDRFIEAVSIFLDPERQDLNGAERAFEQAREGSAWMFRDPRVIDLRAALDKQIKAFSEDREAFDAAFALTRSLSFDDPQAWDTLTRAEALAPDDRKRAVQTERDRLEAQLADFASSIAGIHAAARDAIMDNYRKVSEEAQQLPHVESARLLADALEPIERELADLIIQGQGASTEWPSEHVKAQVARMMEDPLRTTRAAHELIQTNRQAAQDAIRMATNRSQRLERIKQTRGRTDLLSGDLRAFIDAFPLVTNEPAGEAPRWFAEVLEHEPAWLAAKAWNNLANSVRTSGTAVGSPKAARDRSDLIGALLAHAPGHQDEFAEYSDYLHKAQSVLDDDGLIMNFMHIIRDAFQSPKYSRMTWVEAASPGEWAYSMAPAGTRLQILQQNNNIFNVPQLVRRESDVEPENVAGLRTVPRKLRGGDDATLKPAGHVQAAKMILDSFKQLEQSGMTNWDQALLDIAIMVRDHPMDDILRLELLRAILNQQINIAWNPKEHQRARASLAALETLDESLAYENWPSSEPNEVVGAKAIADRAKVREALDERLPDLEAVREYLQSVVDDVQPNRLYEATAIVWFNADAPGDRSQRFVSGSTSFNGLHTLTLVDGRLSAQPVEVDRSGRIQSPAGLPPGTPLFRVDVR